VLVRLAGAREPPSIVEGERVELGHAGEQRLEVRGGEQGVLLLEVPGDEQGVVLEDVELVQQARVRGRHVPHEELLLIRRKERVLRRPSLRGRPDGSRLALQAGDDADEKADPLVLDELHLCVDGYERAAGQRLGRALDDGAPEHEAHGTPLP
jgi:hypothetical protein